MKNKILLGIFIICLISSIILVTIPAEEACGTNQEGTNGCQIVEESSYAKTIGINNSYFGIIAFLILIALTVSQMKHPNKHKKRFIMIGILICSLVGIYFLFLQFFVIKEFCKYCLVVDIGSIFSLIALLYYRNHED
jgi:uncharacterized membrane protein